MCCPARVQALPQRVAHKDRARMSQPLSGNPLIIPMIAALLLHPLPVRAGTAMTAQALRQSCAAGDARSDGVCTAVILGVWRGQPSQRACPSWDADPNQVVALARASMASKAARPGEDASRYALRTLGAAFGCRP